MRREQQTLVRRSDNEAQPECVSDERSADNTSNHHETIYCTYHQTMKVIYLFLHICCIQEIDYSTMADYVSFSCSLCGSVDICSFYFLNPF